MQSFRKVKLFVFKGIIILMIVITLGIFVCCKQSDVSTEQEVESVIVEQKDFDNPIIEQRADPWVYKHTDGFYYFTASVPEYDRIILRKAETI